MDIKLYTIKGKNQTVRVFILNKTTRIERKSRNIKANEVIIQSWDTGETSVIAKSKLLFDQEVN